MGLVKCIRSKNNLNGTIATHEVNLVSPKILLLNAEIEDQYQESVLQPKLLP